MILCKDNPEFRSLFNHYSFGFMPLKMEGFLSGFCDFFEPFEVSYTYDRYHGVEIEVLWGEEMTEYDFSPHHEQVN
jgi:hypothetical protein